MEKKKVIKALENVVATLTLERELEMSATHLAEYLYKQLEILKWQKELNASKNVLPLFETPIVESEKTADNDIVNEFVDRMYALYPTKCPKRNASLGKSRKDKIKIKKLLKTYSQEEIERVIKHEVESNYGVNYMRNFSTFLNNFPDPNDAPIASVREQSNDKVIFNGVEYK